MYFYWAVLISKIPKSHTSVLIQKSLKKPGQFKPKFEISCKESSLTEQESSNLNLDQEEGLNSILQPENNQNRDDCCHLPGRNLATTLNNEEIKMPNKNKDKTWDQQVRVAEWLPHTKCRFNSTYLLNPLLLSKRKVEPHIGLTLGKSQ